MRTLSANVPYSTNYGRAIHTNIGNLDHTKQVARGAGVGIIDSSKKPFGPTHQNISASTKKPAHPGFLMRNGEAVCQNSLKKELKNVHATATEAKPILSQIGILEVDMAPKHLNFNALSSSSSDLDDDCADVGEDSLPA